ncbi:MAG: AmmeMemoRadiSam system protein B [Spirochaetaceae bacterium]|nr:AmmeMemoRadiSam system protein B [Spirochaetaceae bacterium]
MRYAIRPAASALPSLRHVDVIPVDQNGVRSFYVRDPLEFATEPLVLGGAGLFILSRLDGRHSFDQVLVALRREFPRTRIRAGQVRDLLNTLSERCYLDDEVAAARIGRLCDEFARARVRQPWHAGSAYPDDERELAAMLDRFFAAAAAGTEAEPSADAGAADRAGVAAATGSGPAAAALAKREGGAGGNGRLAVNNRATRASLASHVQPRGELAAIMCPHIDLRAGGETYPPAFTALAAEARAPRPVELYVILGVAHNGGTRPGASFAIACDKNYATPFGEAPTDRRLVGEWSRRAGRDVTDQQWVHRTEHSVEFPLLFLQYIQAHADLPRYEVVPVLLGGVDHYLQAGRDPLRAPEVKREMAALRAAVAASGKRACYLLSVDLAHIGPKFGDPERVDDAGAAACEQKDRHLLSFAERFDAPGLTRTLHADGNRRNVDAVSGLFSLYPLLAGCACRGSLLSYGQNRQPDTGSLVSYASMAFYHTPGAPE